MSEVLLFTVLTLCIVGVLAAVVLYFVAQKFKVYEDPRIDAVESMLPGANCGGCGYPGCRANCPQTKKVILLFAATICRRCIVRPEAPRR